MVGVRPPSTGRMMGARIFNTVKFVTPNGTIYSSVNSRPCRPRLCYIRIPMDVRFSTSLRQKTRLWWLYKFEIRNLTHPRTISPPTNFESKALSSRRPRCSSNVFSTTARSCPKTTRERNLEARANQSSYFKLWKHEQTLSFHWFFSSVSFLFSQWTELSSTMIRHLFRASLHAAAKVSGHETSSRSKGRPEDIPANRLVTWKEQKGEREEREREEGGKGLCTLADGLG